MASLEPVAARAAGVGAVDQPLRAFSLVRVERASRDQGAARAAADFHSFALPGGSFSSVRLSDHEERWNTHACSVLLLFANRADPGTTFLSVAAPELWN